MRFYLLLCVFIGACNSRQAQTNVAAEPIGPKEFSKIVFHSTRCFGSCPEIDFQLDSNRHILLNRQFYRGKGEIDSTNSGQFEGTLDEKNFDELQAVLKASNYKTLKFPDTNCCDAPLRTIIIYDANNQRTYLKSMFPPPEADSLITVLRKIGVETTLPRVNKEVKLEE